MAYGLLVTGHNNTVCLNSDVKSMVYMGKATRITGTNLTLFPADLTGNRVEYIFWLNRTTNYPAAAGHRDITCTGYCNSGNSVNTLPNDNGCYTYSIESYSYPQVFVNTTNYNVTGIVLAIVDTGTTGPQGWPIWYIKLGVSYPVGWRDTALPYLSLYCFSPIPPTTSTNYGIATYDSAGNITFSNATKPLRIKDIISVNSISFSDPNNLTTISINHTRMANPVVSVYDMTKPSFLNIDFARYQWLRSFNLGNIAYGYNDYWGYCEDYAPTYGYLNQTFLIGGLRPNLTDTDIAFNLLGLDTTAYGCLRNPASSLGKYEQLPSYVPVIDGADYD